MPILVKITCALVLFLCSETPPTRLGQHKFACRLNSAVDVIFDARVESTAGLIQPVRSPGRVVRILVLSITVLRNPSNEAGATKITAAGDIKNAPVKSNAKEPVLIV